MLLHLIFKKAKKILKYRHYYLENFARRYSGKSNMNPDKNGEYLVLKKALYTTKGDFIYFDGGANIGDNLLFLNKIKTKFDSLNIFSFAVEATPSTFKLLQKRAKNSNTTFINKALSNEEGELDFYIESKENKTNINSRQGSNSALPHYYLNDGEKITIPATTIDAIIRKYNLKKIDFLKLDIEGYEYRALQGASNSMLKGIIKFIQLEYNQTWILSGASIKDIFDLCEKYDYELYRICSKELLKITYYHYLLDDFVYCNLLLIKKGCNLPLPYFKEALP